MATQVQRRSRQAMSPGAALVVLRLFLGVTFAYAGIQKLSDPGFLHPGATTYIGTQLHAFANHTPGGFLLNAFAIPHPKLAGVVVAFTEIFVGLLTIAGLLTRLAALAGLSLNLVLFLTNSWNTSPYFLGSDIVFVFAWLPFVLAGAQGQPALDHSLDRLARSPRTRRRGAAAPGEPALTRRAVLTRALGVTGFAALGLGGIAALAKGPYRGTARTLGGAGSASASRTTGAGPAQSSHPRHAKRAARHSNVPRNAIKLGRSSRLPRNQAATYRDPSDGGTDILIRQGDGSLKAFSAVWTHAGCTVGYQGGQIVCPCHGGVYSAQTGAVVSGPPPSGLAPRRVMESGGAIYALPS